MNALQQAIDAKDQMTERELHEIPKWAKIVLVFVERAGFPVVSFFLMWYLSAVSLKGIERALTENTDALHQFIQTSTSFQSMVMQEHARMLREIEGLRRP